jgi:hypothetical protein
MPFIIYVSSSEIRCDIIITYLIETGNEYINTLCRNSNECVIFNAAVDRATHISRKFWVAAQKGKPTGSIPVSFVGWL